ncbi:MAG: DUF4350 domain-containing protein [Pyrinomonadaceae bacterium]
MRQKLFIFGFLMLMIAVLIGLNAASYTQKEKTPDSEVSPNRSTYNTGATGTQAFYTLLAETGRNVVQWEQSPNGLLTARQKPAVFVMVGSLRRDVSSVEIEELLRWVADGGRLVLIDRQPLAELVATTANWQVSVGERESDELFSADPSDRGKMVADAGAIRPIHPSVFTQGVNAVQPSRFATSISIERLAETDGAANVKGYDWVEAPSQNAPVLHLADAQKNLVVSAAFGGGQIAVLSDPYVVSNGGIALVDNAQLAVNLVGAGDGVIAFDEFHQGYGSDDNRFLQFFAGTPVVAIFMQTVILVGLVFFSQSRRFARPVPEAEASRLSKLEYVAAMAELQGRTKAYDLAIENIYTDFRRRVSRHFGVDNTSSQSGAIAALAAERTGIDKAVVVDAMHRCEEIIRGEPTNKKQVIRLITSLRTIEGKLGLTRRVQKQALECR